VISSPWRDNQDKDYSEACSKCEVKVRVTKAWVQRLKPLLKYDKRAAGACGRALTKDVPGLGLLEGDRLEPSDALADVGRFEDLCPEDGDSVEVTFWRRSEETICMHRVPLWDEQLCITPSRVLCMDLLHTLYLGVMLGFCRHMVWRLLTAGVWGSFESNEGEAFKVAVMCFRHELFQWYEARARAHRDECLTRVADFVPSMLGSKGKKALKTKAAETYGILLFLADMVRKYASAFGTDQRRLAEACDRLLRCVEICRSNGVNLPARHLQDLSAIPQ
jgi:hypothetical protein